MANVQMFDPFGEAGIDELFRGFFRPVRANDGGAASIKVDVYENDKGYVIQAEVPGVRKEDIQVTIEGNQVAIGAEVKREAEAREGQRLLRSERRFGSMHRSFVLPTEIDEAASEARYQDGVLELTLVRKAAQAGRRLAVQ